VDAGSCNGCELEIHALNNAFLDLEHYGLRFVASPSRRRAAGYRPGHQKHARGVAPDLACHARLKWVIAVGDCGADGGVFASSYAVVGSVSPVVPVDLVIQGCPPTPKQLLAGLLSLFGPGAIVAPP
jgi:Ni,Fe-hydrogenase III small subunit